MTKLYYSLLVLLLSVTTLLAQQGTVKGQVYSMKSNDPLELATVRVLGTNLGARTDVEGRFVISGVKPGFVRLIVTMLGYETTTSAEVQVVGNQTSFIDIALDEASTSLSEVVVRPNMRLKRAESPLSLQTLGIKQIEKSAGANRDISKLVQTLPGVGATDPNRNDLIVRGGGPSENVFYLDGIEIPVINHFSTQGASGGVVGMINPDFVREISFYTGAFPASRTNALSSVMEIKQRDGDADHMHLKASVGASDAALTIEGPLGKKSSFIASARQSYLQWLFKAIKLPFLPTYNDFQLKYKHRFNAHNELTILGIGAIDNMSLNTQLQTTGTEVQRYILSYLPQYKQWNYTVGAVYKHYGSGHVDSWVLSRNMLRNSSVKHQNNDPTLPKLSEYQSDETESKLRYERVYTTLPFKLSFGAGLRYADYRNRDERLTYRSGQVVPLSYYAHIKLLAYSAFAQASDEYLDKRLKLALGVNLVGNTLNSAMSNPLPQLSPRFSASFALTDDIDLNANFGRYAMQPSYTSMGYRTSDGTYPNKARLRYIMSNQAVLGAEYHPGDYLRFSAEGFYKSYSAYPISEAEGISLASKGTEYGQVGAEAVLSTGQGRAYGVEVVARLMPWHQFSATATYTLFRSEFTDKTSIYRPSSWDTRQMLNLLISYRMGKSWYLSASWRYSGGAPYTPIDMELSTNKAAWAVTNRAYPDYTQFNTLRLPAKHQLDLRLDKEFYFKRWMLNLYLDVQNAYLSSYVSAPVYTNRDASGRVMDHPTDPERQQVRQLDYYSKVILPTLGLIVKL
nr:TonB-dependent receptor [uncultured Porphyromonas sp.]